VICRVAENFVYETNVAMLDHNEFSFMFNPLVYLHKKCLVCFILNQVINFKELCDNDPQLTMLDCAYKTCNHAKNIRFFKPITV
jgi:hypothetical protein